MQSQVSSVNINIIFNFTMKEYMSIDNALIGYLSVFFLIIGSPIFESELLGANV